MIQTQHLGSHSQGSLGLKYEQVMWDGTYELSSNPLQIIWEGINALPFADVITRKHFLLIYFNFFLSCLFYGPAWDLSVSALLERRRTKD